MPSKMFVSVTEHTLKNIVRRQSIGPLILQLAIHMVQNRLAGEQKSQWDKTKKGNYHLKLWIPFVCHVPVVSSTGVLYHVNG